MGQHMRIQLWQAGRPRQRKRPAPPGRWETDDGTSALLTMPQVHALIFKGVLEHVLGNASISNPEPIHAVTLANHAPSSCKDFADAVEDWAAALRAKRCKETQNQLMNSLAKLANALNGINAAMQEYGASDE